MNRSTQTSSRNGHTDLATLEIPDLVQMPNDRVRKLAQDIRGGRKPPAGAGGRILKDLAKMPPDELDDLLRERQQSKHAAPKPKRQTQPQPPPTATPTPVPPPAPSANGSNGDAVPTPTPTTPPPKPATEGRNADGRFAKGWKGGPGNPFSRRVATLRTAILEELKPERLRLIIETMIEKAEAGDVAAAKVVLAYSVGTPRPAVDPDRLDLDEWNLASAAPTSDEFWRAMLTRFLPPEFAASMIARRQQTEGEDLMQQEGMLRCIIRRLQAQGIWEVEEVARAQFIRESKDRPEPTP